MSCKQDKGTHMERKVMSIDSKATPIFYFIPPTLASKMREQRHAEYLKKSGLSSFVLKVSWDTHEHSDSDLVDFIHNFNKNGLQTFVKGHSIDLSIEAIRKTFKLEERGLLVERKTDNYTPTSFKGKKKDNGFLLSSCEDDDIKQRLEFQRGALHILGNRSEVSVSHVKQVEDPKLGRDWGDYLGRRLLSLLDQAQNHLRGGKGFTCNLGSHIQVILNECSLLLLLPPQKFSIEKKANGVNDWGGNTANDKDRKHECSLGNEGIVNDREINPGTEEGQSKHPLPKKITIFNIGAEDQHFPTKESTQNIGEEENLPREEAEHMKWSNTFSNGEVSALHVDQSRTRAPCSRCQHLVELNIVDQLRTEKQLWIEEKEKMVITIADLSTEIKALTEKYEKLTKQVRDKNLQVEIQYQNSKRKKMMSSDMADEPTNQTWELLLEQYICENARTIEDLPNVEQVSSHKLVNKEQSMLQVSSWKVPSRLVSIPGADAVNQGATKNMRQQTIHEVTLPTARKQGTQATVPTMCNDQSHNTMWNLARKQIQATVVPEPLQPSTKPEPKGNIVECNKTIYTTKWEDEDAPYNSTSASRHPQLPHQYTVGINGSSLVQSKTNQNLNVRLPRRKPQKWSWDEEKLLEHQVGKYGKGHWKLILENNQKSFQGRTEVDLKDKWRNLMAKTKQG